MTNTEQMSERRGFTIIEVVLVLAIAALIFLMVFIALPALQRNQRDTARKELLTKVVSGITTYQSNKRGAQPTTGSDLAPYVDGTVGATDVVGELDPGHKGADEDALLDNNYALNVTTCDKLSCTPDASSDGVRGNADTNYIQVITGGKCNDAGDGAIRGTLRDAAVVMIMENAKAPICQAV